MSAFYPGLLALAAVYAAAFAWLVLYVGRR